MEWWFFALLATVLWAAVITIDKIILTEYITEPILLVLLLGMIGLIAAGFEALIQPVHFVELVPFLLSLLQGALYTASAYLYFQALAVEEMTRIAPVFQTIPLMTLLLSAIFLDEILALLQYVGVALVLCGALLVSVRRSHGRLPRLSKPFWLTFVASILSAISWVLSRYVLQSISYWDLFFWARIGSFIGLIGLLLAVRSCWRHLRRLRTLVHKAVGLFALSESMSLIALFLSRVALANAEASVVSTITAAHPLFVFFYAFFLTRFFPLIPGLDAERKNLIVKLAASLVIVLGIYLIAQ